MRACFILQIAAVLTTSLGLGCGPAEEEEVNEPAVWNQAALSESASGIFFHGMDLDTTRNKYGWGRNEGNAWAYAPDLYAINAPPRTFYPDVWRWRDYATVAGYSAGRKPMLDYLRARGGSVRYAVLFDPSYPDRGLDYGKEVIRPWLAGDSRRRVLMLVGPASESSAILDQYIASVKGTPEWARFDVCHVSTPHLNFPVAHFSAIGNPGYRPGWCE